MLGEVLATLGNVRDTTFTDALTAIPAMNQAAGLKAGLMALGEAQANERLRQEIEFNKWQVQQQAKQNRMAGLRLAGQSLAGFLGGGLQLPQRKDPRTLQLEQEAYQQQMRGFRAGKNVGSNAMAAQVLKGLL